MAAIFIALRNLELAETVAMTFAGPIFVTLFSIFFLSEKVRATRWSAVIVGFIGVIFITTRYTRSYVGLLIGGLKYKYNLF